MNPDDPARQQAPEPPRLVPSPPDHLTPGAEGDRDGEDPLGWLRLPYDPRVQRLLRAENDYSRSLFRELRDLRRELVASMLGRFPEDDASVPVQHGPYLYTTRQSEGQPYVVHTRRRVGSDGREEVILDENELAAKRSYCAVRALAVSPDHRLLAFVFDPRGDERHTLEVRDLEDGSTRYRATLYRATDVGPSLAWAADSTTLFFTVLDSSHRSHQVRRVYLGAQPFAEVQVLEEEDAAYQLELSQSESGEFLFFASRSPSSTELRYLNARAPFAKPRVFCRRQAGVRYAVTHHGDHFYVLSNESGADFELWRTLCSAVERKHWQAVALPEGVSPERLVARSDH
ncbi:MAG: hypothetical protein AAF560_32635, partial [Acidobacteriota bacterium]